MAPRLPEKEGQVRVGGGLRQVPPFDIRAEPFAELVFIGGREHILEKDVPVHHCHLQRPPAGRPGRGGKGQQHPGQDLALPLPHLPIQCEKDIEVTVGTKAAERG